MRVLLCNAQTIFLFAGFANAMIIRHDVDDQKYLDLGEVYSHSVAYIGGCASTLIDKYWILTAAHCVRGRENAILFVQHVDKEYRVEKIVLHPDFDMETAIRHDIALVQLKEPIEAGEPAMPYLLTDEEGQSVVFVGRGTFGNGRDGLIKEDGKQRGATNVVNSASEQTIGFKFDLPEDATPTEGISGRGDSGGPAFITQDSQLYVAGVSSYQDGNRSEEGTYGVLEYYTRVSTNARWIDSVMQRAEPPIIVNHPVIEAVKQGSERQLREAFSSEVLEDDAVLSEVFLQTVVSNRIELAEELFTLGANINSIAINGVSLFGFSLLNDRPEYFNRLVESFSQYKNIHKENSLVLPLLIAMRKDDPQLTHHAKILLDQGVNIDVQTEQDETAIILAGWITNNIELIRLLIERGADVNIPNNNGDTPLIDAAYLGKNEILELLLKSGADKDVRNKRGKSAMDMAQHTKNKKAIELLKSHDTNRWSR